MKKLGLIALPVLLAAAGCSTGSNNGASTASPSPAAAGETKAPQSSAAAPVKLRISQIPNVAEFPAGLNENNNPFRQYINQKLGHDIEWSIQPKENANEKLSIMLASGDAPDVIFTTDKQLFGKLAAQGELAALDDVLKSQPEIMKAVPPEVWNGVKVNGKIYGIPNPVATYVNEGLMVRTDILQQYGLKTPQTTDELYSVLKELKAKNPDLIPYTTTQLDIASINAPANSINALAAPFGVNAVYSDVNGKVVNTRFEPAMKQYLEFTSKLYAEGLMDKEFLVNKRQNVNEKITSGKAVMTTINPFDGKSLAENTIKNNPNAKLEFIPALTGPDGKSGYLHGNPIAIYIMFPKSGKNLTEAVSIFNQYLSDPDIMNRINYGEEGVHYSKKDGAMVPIQPASDEVKYKIYYRLWSTRDVHKNNLKLGGFEPYVNPLVGQDTQYDLYQLSPPIAKVDEKSNAMKQVEVEYVSKIISVAMKLDKYDEFVAKYKEAGADEALQAVSAWYETVKDSIKK